MIFTVFDAMDLFTQTSNNNLIDQIIEWDLVRLGDKVVAQEGGNQSNQWGAKWWLLQDILLLISPLHQSILKKWSPSVTTNHDHEVSKSDIFAGEELISQKKTNLIPLLQEIKIIPWLKTMTVLIWNSDQLFWQCRFSHSCKNRENRPLWVVLHY